MARSLVLSILAVWTMVTAPDVDAAAQRAAGRAMTDAAEALLSSLSADQRSKASFAFDDDRRFVVGRNEYGE